MLVLYGTCKVHHKRGWNPLAPILLRLMSFLAAGLRIFPLRVRQRRSLENFPEMKVRSVVAGRRSLG